MVSSFFSDKKSCGSWLHSFELSDLASSSTFKTQINAINTDLVGELNIGITDNMVTIPQMRITRAISALKNMASEIIINIRMIPPNEVETAILDGQLHIGIVPDLRTLPGLTYMPLYKEKSLFNL